MGGTSTWSLGHGEWMEGDYYENVGGLVGAFNAGRVKVTGDPSPTEQLWLEPVIEDLVRSDIFVHSVVESVVLDEVTGQIESISNVGVVQFTGTRIAGVLTGGAAMISNLRFDLANKTVVADLSGVKSAFGTNPSVSYNLPGATFLTFTDVATAIEVIDSTTFASSLTFSGLRFSTTGYNFLKSSLGLGGLALFKFTNLSEDGSIQARLVFSSPVPEPGTYALLGVGLVGLCVGAHRRKQSKEAS